MKTGFRPFAVQTLLRSLERLLPADILYWIVKPVAYVRAAFGNTIPLAAPPPGYFQRTASESQRERTRNSVRSNHAIRFFEDRLALPKWQNRCLIRGLSHLQEARQSGRRVVLTFLHCGPCGLFPCWLRSAGIPVVPLAVGKAEQRSELSRIRDRLSRFPDIPSVLYMDQLREMVAALAAGNVLLIAADSPAGKQVDVPLDDGWTFRMATGPIRLACRFEAELIPCSIIDEGHWHFCIEMGMPVARRYLTGDPDFVAAGKHLLAEMLPHIEQHVDQCGPFFSGFFHRKTADMSTQEASA